MQQSLWTKSGARLNLIKSYPGPLFNWIFLPGGPGLGSESLIPLTNILSLPGHMWLLDLPGDGSNVSNHNTDFSGWCNGIVEAAQALDKVIMVAHSTGGMYVLASAKLKNHLSGLVLMNSAPDCSWQEGFSKHVKENPIELLNELHKRYNKCPSNDILKEMTLLSAPYLFTKKVKECDIKFLENLPYNISSHEWSDKHFDSTYKAAWVPDNIPTLIFSGSEDIITPLDLFKSNPQYKSQKNIQIELIKDAGHFPWIEQPGVVKELVENYSKRLYFSNSAG